MESIRSSLDNIKLQINSLIDSDDALTRLNLVELDELLQLKHVIFNSIWIERQKDCNTIKERYINLLQNDNDRIKAILHWKDSKDWINVVSAP